MTATETQNTQFEITDEMIEVGLDFERYAPTNLKIQTMEGELVDFSFNPVQLVLHKIKRDIVNDGRLLRMWVLKARREGISTDTTACFYHKTTHTKNRYAMHVTHEPDATDFIFGMIKRYYDHAPLKPKTRFNNTSILEFNTKEGTGLDSAIRVGTAGKLHLGSGQLIHYLHLSELAKWPKHTVSALLTSLINCVPDEPDTEIVGESTAAGTGGEFHDNYWAARYRYEVFIGKDGNPDFKCTINPDADKDNEFSSVFIPWFVFPKYQTDPEPGFVRTPYEQEMVARYGLNDCHLQYRRWAIQNKCRGDERIFRQEYPSNAKEAFLASGRPIVDAEKADDRRKACKKPIAYYECLTSIGQFISKTPLSGDTDKLLQVWEEPKPGVPYVISADVAEGIMITSKHADFSNADVIEQLTGKQVAQWHGRIDAVQFGILLKHIGYRYNTAWLVPERNNHGGTVCGKLVEMSYPNIYVETQPNPPHQPVKRYGWVTKGGKYGDAKSLVIDNLVELFNNGAEGIVCPETYWEMMSMKHNDDGTIGAESGCFDDRVMSYAIGQWVRKRLPLPSAIRAAMSGGNAGPTVPAGALV